MDEDCIVETEIPVKEKKLKQARLPFQILSDSPKTGKSEKESPVTNKKRKLSSPSPLQNKSSKIIKITSKENETVDVKDNGNGPADISDDGEKNDVDKKKSRIADKKTEQKTETKSNLMTRFLVRTDKDTKKTAQESSKKSKRSEEDKVDKIEKVSDKSEKKRNSSKGEDVKSKKDQDDAMVVDIDEEADEQSSKADAEEDDGESPESEKTSKSDVGSPESKFDESKDKEKEESDEEDISVNSSSDEEDESEVSQVEDLNTSSQLLTTPSSVTKKVVNSDRKKMTPKQLQKQLEKVKRQEERQKLKLEKEKKKEEEDKKKEMKRKEKEQKRKEKEEKQKEKEALEKKKEEEKRKKKEAKEEEEKKKMEEKLEVERKKQKAASNFMGFFVAKKPETKNAEDKQTNKFTNFMPFEVKTDMKIAPITRRELSDEEKLKMDELRAKNDAKKAHLYLRELRSNDFVIRRSPKTFPLEMKDDDIVIIEDDEVESVEESVVEKGSIPIEKHRPKLLYFHENRRPPYWGTWRKKSKTINPRRPYAKDNKWFDYEIDSDDEWEEEEPGESLHGSDDEKDKDEENNPEENEYDVDNEFMVPHGYLSDEEVREDEEEEEDMSPETQKFKLKVLGDEFEAERNEKTLKLKPKVIGCIWTNEHGTLPESTSSRIMQLLTARQAWVCETPININAAPDVDNRHASENLSSVPNSEEKSSRGAKKKEVPDEAIPHMIRLLHGNNINRHDLAKEFIEFLKRENSNKQSVSKRSFFCKLREIANWMACPDEGPMSQKLCWYVSEDIRKQYLGDEKLELPNKWTYVLTPKRRPELANKEDTEEKRNFPLITQFAKNITHEEMKKQLQELKSTPSPGQQKPVKRATLISVPRGEQLPKSPRVSLLDKFVAAASKNNSASASKVTEDDVITIEDD